MGDKIWGILFGLMTAFIVVTAFMPDRVCIEQWQWWIGGGVGLGIVFGMVGYHEIKISKLEDKIKELENRIKR